MISFIVAMANDNVIGKDGKMPWHLPNDLKYFKRVTTGYPVLMGRKTYESIGKPLANRRNIVLTRDKSFHADGIEVIHSLKEVEPLMKDSEEFFVIGGATLYEQLLPLADRLYVTKIHAQFEGDTYFPQIDEDEWQVVHQEQGIIDDKNVYEHTFYVYERKQNK